MKQQELIEEHGFVASTLFKTKVLGLTCIQFAKHLVAPRKKFQFTNQLNNQPVISFSESDLWNEHDTNKNWILTAGKIENLRISAQKLNGLEVGAGETFSFWKHIGNPNIGKGFVVGREIREGCIVPTIAGGLCQLSNALYDAALKANFQIVERHKHTKVIKGSLAEKDRDATVKWNYLDLKFKSNYPFRIEVNLTTDKLVVSFKSEHKNTEILNGPTESQEVSKLNDCYSCGNTSCFKHPNKVSEKQKISNVTYLLDEMWPEYDRYVSKRLNSDDEFITSFKKNPLIKTNRYNWSTKGNKVQNVFFSGLKRALKMRNIGNKNVFEAQLKLDTAIAKKMAKKIPVHSSHLVISQNLLPGLYESGALGGRTFDVLMTRLPIAMLQEELNKAAIKHPESNTLNDFRANEKLIDVENTALTKARKIITPHAKIAAIFSNKAVKLEWQLPKVRTSSAGNKILFPASTVGRKGCYALRAVLRELNVPVVLMGRNLEGDDFWKGLKTEPFNGNWQEVGLVVYPAHVENQPRNLLKAVAFGIPVIASVNCGLVSAQLVEIAPDNSLETLLALLKPKLAELNQSVYPT